MVIGGPQCPIDGGAAAPSSVTGPAGAYTPRNTPYVTGHIMQEPQFWLKGKQVDIASLGQVMKFKDTNFGVFGQICGIKRPLEGGNAAALCLHCLVGGFKVSVVVDERGKAVPPPKHKKQPMDLPWIYLSRGKSSKFVTHWNTYHGSDSLGDKLPRAQSKKRRHRDITSHLPSDGAKYQERALMLVYNTSMRMSFRTAV